MDVVNDITISTGPMDVLDHSCSKLGFGGKMAIDATAKFSEEIDDVNHLQVQPVMLPDNFAERFEGITKINTSLLKKAIPCLIVSVKKSKAGHLREIHDQICNSAEVEGVKMILYVEHTVDADHLPVALWRLCNNMDPKRDSILYQAPSKREQGKTFACLGLDGTIKTKKFDNFQRDWPNIIVADDVTIKSVDEKWEKLNIGPFIPSPSLKFKNQMYGEEAVVSLENIH
jgi:4-hydroxy-3-polyprenylbenzoate decarboxylase